MAHGDACSGHRTAAGEKKRAWKGSVTIAYRLDSLGHFPDDVALHKIAAEPCRPSPAEANDCAARRSVPAFVGNDSGAPSSP
jgi:hypothetical protein